MADPALGARFLKAKRALFDKKYSRLNKEQREAIYCIHGPLLILAGAGSGKTTVLVHRVTHIVRYGNAYASERIPEDITEQTVETLEKALSFPPEALDGILSAFAEDACPPWAVLCFTFTNKAANEMKERLSATLGEQSADDIHAGTFHSVCLRILRREGERVGLRSGFTIYDTDDTKRLLRDCLAALNIDEKLLSIKTVQNAVSRAKEQLLTVEDYDAEAGGDYKLQMAAKVYREYQKRLLENNAVDFDDIICKTVELLQNHEQVRSYYQHRYKYVCVDEYQDTNHAQFVLISLLSGHYHNVMVIGDDDQSIYAFRGATIENILGFDRMFRDTHTIKLEQNYRSTGNILGAANSVIARNVGRHRKRLWTEQGDGEKVLVKKLETQNLEARYIADEILRASAGGKRPLSDFAVLYRTNAQSQALESAFTRSGLAYRVLSGTRFYDRKEIKDVIAYLCLINNPADNVRLKRVVNEPKRGIGNTSLAAVEQIAQAEGVSMFAVMENASKYIALSRVAPNLAGFVTLIHSLAKLSTNVSLPELFRETIEQSGYHAMLEAGGEAERDRLENVDELISTAVEYEQNNPEATLAGFLEEVALVSDVDQYDRDADAVVMMTIHSAKGLEFPVVFMPGMEDGLFPGHRSMNDASEMEEERRLAYVAITRAKQKLIMTHARERLMFGSTSYNPPSCFIGEIDERYLERAEEPTARQRTDFYTRSAGSTGRTELQRDVFRPRTAPKELFSIGDRVVHASFGAGTVLSVKDMGGDTLYEVAFDTVGTKKMMATYARLRKE